MLSTYLVGFFKIFLRLCRISRRETFPYLSCSGTGEARFLLKAAVGLGNTFIMNGGSITGNKQGADSKSSGGGVSVRKKATFIMNGGSITNNETTGKGGGVFVETATFTMNGGTISGNKCPKGTDDYEGAGVYVYHHTSNDNHATFNVSGSAIVTGNTKGTNTKDNVYLCDNTIINVTGALTTSANIGVRMATVGDFAQGSGYTLTTSDADRFSSDVGGYCSALDSETGKLYLTDQDPALLSVLTWNRTGKYFEIRDEQDLIDLGNYTKDSEGNTCEGLTFKLTTDLDFSSHTDNDCVTTWGKGNFIPIGASWFKGTFDGQEHTITGLRFNTNGNSGACGLFRRVESPAVVQNVTLLSPQMAGSAETGGIVGLVNGGAVSNCTVVDGTIGRIWSSTSGGVIGTANVKNNDVTVNGCTVVNTSVSSGNQFAGIIAGECYSGDNTLTISGCTYHNPNSLAVCGGSRPYKDGGSNTQVYRASLADGVTTSSTAAYSHGNDYYFTENATVTLGHSDRDGYTFNGYTASAGTLGGNDTDGYTLTMPAADVTVSAAFAAIPATAPTITEVNGAELTYGYTSGSVSVAASAAEGHTITGYQWYSSTTNSNENGTAIDGATEVSYTVPTGKNVGTTEYYYCVVTATRTDNSQTAETTSSVATVSIGKAKGPAAPTGLAGVAPTTENGSDGKITGVDTTMEYSANGTDYTACTGAEITGLSAGTYYVRVAETDTHHAGAAAAVEVPAAYTVTFAAGYENPTGTMACETVDSGATYTLPACGFTAPANKGFKEWSVVIGEAAAVTKAPNETITVTANTTVTAVWEDTNPGKLASATLSLQNDITVNYYAQFTQEPSALSLAVTRDGKTTTLTGTQTNTSPYTYKFAYKGVNPQCMGDNLSATLTYTVDGTQYTDTVAHYSVKQYCMNMLNKTDEQLSGIVPSTATVAELKTLLVDVLNYGAEAQKYMNYQTDALVTSDLTPEQKAFASIYAKPDANKGVVTSLLSGDRNMDYDWQSASLYLTNAFTMRFYFNAASTDGLIVKTSNGDFSGSQIHTTSTSGQYYIEFDKMNANTFRNQVTASFEVNGTATGQTLTYSINTYVSRQDAGTAASFIKSIYNYGEAALAYMN